MKHSIVLALLALLVSVTVVAGAGTPPGSFSTTGYTTNLVPIPVFPYLIPSDYGFLPGDYAKFRIQARGGPLYADDALCQSLYGAPSCDALCQPFGAACGAHGSFEGSFSFDELGVVSLATGSGANDGLMTITTADGTANVRFGGPADATSVRGAFQFQGGSNDFRRWKGNGSYAGDAGYLFTVAYEPCGLQGQPACPAVPCATRGEVLKLLHPKVIWALANYGEQPVHLESLLLYWPEQNGALTGVRLGGKLLASGFWPAPWVELDLSTGLMADREIRSGKGGKLTLDFEFNGIGQAPADYTFLARFAEGCSAIHVAFP